MKYIFSILFSVIAFAIYGQGFDHFSSEAKINFDTLKWKMYSLTHDVKVKRFVLRDEIDNSNDSLYSTLECTIKCTDIEISGDSIMVYLGFYKCNEPNQYVQLQANRVLGIGYLRGRNIFFPIFGKSALDIDMSSYPKYFKKKEMSFCEYLKTYKGNLDLWVLSEAKRRKIL